MCQVRSPVAIAAALADDTRMAVLNRLADGPASVSELVALLGQSQSKISNHLAQLRRVGLVTTRRAGRRVIYRLQGESIATLLEALGALSRGSDRSTATPALAKARTCYDHVAGSLGVALFDWLVAEGAIRVDGDQVGLGPRGDEVFARIGVDVEAASRARRRFAVPCMDWTERQVHLGGSLGAALCSALVRRGWVERRPATRALRVTPAGRRGLRRLVGREVGSG